RFPDKLEKLRAANEELAEQNPEGNIPLTISEVVDPEKLSPIEREALRALNEQSIPKRYRLSIKAVLEDWTDSPLVTRKASTISKNTRAVTLFLAALRLEDIILSDITRKQVKDF